MAICVDYAMTAADAAESLTRGSELKIQNQLWTKERNDRKLKSLENLEENFERLAQGMVTRRG
jgi:hypothetical protein